MLQQKVGTYMQYKKTIGFICKAEQNMNACNVWAYVQFRKHAMQNKHTSMQAIKIRINMQLVQTVGLNCKNKINR